MADTARARELVGLAETTVEADPDAAMSHLSEAATILDAIDLDGTYDPALVGRSVRSYVSLAQNAAEGSEDRRQAVRAGIDRASRKMSLARE